MFCRFSLKLDTRFSGFGDLTADVANWSRTLAADMPGSNFLFLWHARSWPESRSEFAWVCVSATVADSFIFWITEAGSAWMASWHPSISVILKFCLSWIFTSWFSCSAGLAFWPKINACSWSVHVIWMIKVYGEVLRSYSHHYLAAYCVLQWSYYHSKRSNARSLSKRNVQHFFVFISQMWKFTSLWITLKSHNCVERQLIMSRSKRSQFLKLQLSPCPRDPMGNDNPATPSIKLAELYRVKSELWQSVLSVICNFLYILIYAFAICQQHFVGSRAALLAINFWKYEYPIWFFKYLTIFETCSSHLTA